jgi:hypothetical protein
MLRRGWFSVFSTQASLRWVAHADAAQSLLRGKARQGFSRTVKSTTMRFGGTRTRHGPRVVAPHLERATGRRRSCGRRGCQTAPERNAAKSLLRGAGGRPSGISSEGAATPWRPNSVCLAAAPTLPPPPQRRRDASPHVNLSKRRKRGYLREITRFRWFLSKTKHFLLIPCRGIIRSRVDPR